MKIELSVVIPTLGRKKEFESLLQSFQKAIGQISYEIIVVDQNTDGLIDSVCERYKINLNLFQHKVNFRGSSKARNYGIDHSRGDYICFPDDDAEFTESTIKEAMKLLLVYKCDCVFGKCVDKQSGIDSVIKFKTEEQLLRQDDLDGVFVEATMFAKREIFDSCRYDESMGVGCIFGSQEGYDLVYRLLGKNKVMLYSPQIVFYHPRKIGTRTSDAEVRRAFYYSCGFGYLCRKHGFRKKYKKRYWKLTLGIPIIAVIRHRELKYYKVQKMGLELGYEYLN